MKYAKRQSRRRFLAVIIVALIVAVWALGSVTFESDILFQVHRAMPEAEFILKMSNGVYSAWKDNTENHFLGHIVLGEANGYGGPLTIAVSVNPSGIIGC